MALRSAHFTGKLGVDGDGQTLGMTLPALCSYLEIGLPVVPPAAADPAAFAAVQKGVNQTGCG